MKKKVLPLGACSLRHQDRKPGPDTGQRDAGDHLDHRGELRPQRDQLSAAAQGENLVEGGATRKTDGGDREREQELGTVDFVIYSGDASARLGFSSAANEADFRNALQDNKSHAIR